MAQCLFSSSSSSCHMALMSPVILWYFLLYTYISLGPMLRPGDVDLQLKIFPRGLQMGATGLTHPGSSQSGNYLQGTGNATLSFQEQTCSYRSYPTPLRMQSTRLQACQKGSIAPHNSFIVPSSPPPLKDSFLTATK